MINMAEIQNTLFGQGEKELKLIPTSFSNSYYRKLLLTHYPKSKGVMGRRFCYDIFYDGRIIGVISAVSIPVTYKPVAKVIYGVDKITKDISLKYLNEIYSFLSFPYPTPLIFFLGYTYSHTCFFSVSTNLNSPKGNPTLCTPLVLPR